MTSRFTGNVPRGTLVVHLRVDTDPGRTWCGRRAGRMDHVHSGDPAAIPELLPGHRVCRMCEQGLARGGVR